MAKGLEKIPEGGERCFQCYRLRLEKTAQLAKEHGFDYFCTTLSISPLKNAQKLNEIGEELADTYGIPWLPSDFKKKNGYKRSVELSALYGLYRPFFNPDLLLLHTYTIHAVPLSHRCIWPAGAAAYCPALYKLQIPGQIPDLLQDRRS